MSEQSKAEESREKYTLEIETPEDFTEDASTMILTSNELCKYTNELFRALFADYEGCQPDMSNGRFSLTLVFNHPKHEDGVHYAVEMPGKDNVSNNIISRTRAYDRLAREGDRYSITEDGKDILTDFVFRNLVNRDGKVNWGTIMSEFTEKTTFYGPGTQYTKIFNIDPKAVCFAIFGKKGDDNAKVDYSVDVKGAINNGGDPRYANYVLFITRANTDRLLKTYEKLGIGVAGSTIIR